MSMQKTMKEVKVVDCSVMDCVYNTNRQCHTMAINVGEVPGLKAEKEAEGCALCDAYMQGREKAGASEVVADVGACHMEDCRYNESMECIAQGIRVDKHSDHAECSTYEEKE